jgi:hypothetical protein
MKAFFRILLIPMLLASGITAAYLRNDAFALDVLIGALILWLLIVCIREVQKVRRSMTAGRSTNTDAQTADKQLNARVRWVASGFASDLSEMSVRAKSLAKELNPTSIEPLTDLFHSEHIPPPELAGAFPGLGQWITARQFAIFEIFYYLGKPSIPTLKRIAFGKYDWTQGNAIEILCRLAADDVDREDIVDQLIANLPSIRDEALGYALGPLLSQTEKNPALKIVIKRLLVVNQFKERYERIGGAVPEENEFVND